MPFMYRTIASCRCSISRDTMACDASASSRSAGKSAFPRYTTAAKTKIRRTAAPRVNSGGRVSLRTEEVFASAARFSTCGNKRHSRTHKHDAGPAGRTHIFAQNVFCSERANHVTECRSRNHETDGLPGKQHQQRIERERQQGHSGPQPSALYRTPKEGRKLSRTQARRISGRFHSVRERNLSPGAAQDLHAQQKRHAHHAAASRRTATSVVRGRVWPTSNTPTQIRRTPAQRRGDTVSCRKNTASRVSSA